MDTAAKPFSSASASAASKISCLLSAMTLQCRSIRCRSQRCKHKEEVTRMLVAEGLVKRYGARRALDGFDLTIEPGEIAGLVGHNGAGKTTFVEVVTGLVRPDSGRVGVGGI